MSVNIRALRNEADFLPEQVSDLASVRENVLAAGHAPAVADGIVGWLVAKANGQPDLTSSKTRSRYRRILAELPTSAKVRRAMGAYRVRAA